jgi:hypothetical protein
MRRLALVLLASSLTGALADSPLARADEAPAAQPGDADAIVQACCPSMSHYRPRTSLVPEMLRSVEGL